MKSLSLALALLALPFCAVAGQAKDKAQEVKDSIPVTVSSKGQEVRTVLMSIFDQEKKQYVIEPNIHFAVFLSLENADFHKALDIVCTLAGLQAELRDGIYFVHVGRNAVVRPVSSPTPAPVQKAAPAPAKPLTPPAAKPVTVPKATVVAGPVLASSLQHHVTTRLSKIDIRNLFDNLSQQSGVKIVVDPKVPAYKLDAFLINTSLRFALNKVTKATNLHWSLPANHTVLISSVNAG